ncbi:MAG: NAD(P)H-dependent glycerol-3-phosphate dehydrogenase [Candidatus Merdivicinus sp.]|jgi:glycerol-3-phosphate dehydrogenase (NAD(P)+)
MAKIAILGTGGFGISLAVMCHRYGHEVTLWGKFPQEIAEIRRYGENKRLLPGVPVDAGIRLTDEIGEIAGSELVLLAVPSFAVRETAHLIADVLEPGVIVGNVGKGLEKGSKKRLSEVIAEEISGHDIVALSGPSHAEEVARGVPTTIVAACLNRSAAETVQDILSNPTLRVYVSDDVTGVELSGALKNIIAVCAGICDGMNLGDNARAALMTRGLAEIARLGIAMGAKRTTFAGLAGVGDLIVTCTSMHSRNHRAGILIGQGVSPAEAVAQIGMTVEGCIAAETAWELAQEKKVSMPIVEQLHLVLTENKDPHQAVADLMGRPARHEDERVWLEQIL